MPEIGQAADAAEEHIETTLRGLPQIGERIVRYAHVTAPVASPIRRGVDADGLHAESSDGEHWFIKIYTPEARHDLSLKAVADASAKAGELQVAPALVDADVDAGVLAYDWLGEGWQWARLDSLASRHAWTDQFALRQAIQSGPRYALERDIFGEIQALDRRANALVVPRPHDLGWMIDEIGAVAESLEAACPERRPAHGDGVSSNVMIHRDGAMRLVDFDVAGNDDPAHDLASMLIEACPYKAQIREAVDLWAGASDAALFARCMLYGIADDLRWGLWGLVRFADSTRSGVEFFKYAQWRLLRARTRIHDRDYDTWCRSF